MMRRALRWAIMACAAVGVLLGAAVAYEFLSHGIGMRVSVCNETAPPTVVTDIGIMVRGDAVRLGAIPRNGCSIVHVHPRGESSIDLSFAVDGERRATGETFYMDSDDWAADFTIRDRGEVFGRCCPFVYFGGSCDKPLGQLRSAPADAGAVGSLPP
jgi:hypothetical protein